MNDSLDHLPEGKRQELARVLEILFREFEDATRSRSSARKQGRILKVLLFGSYARGDWVDDPVGGYKSDYDLLVVVNADELTDTAEYWMEADQHLLQAYEIAHQLTAPAHFIVHSLSDVNHQLARGRPFFTQIVREGVALYEAPDHPFAKPARLSPQEAYAEAKANFDNWFPSASDFADQARYAISKNRTNVAAFELHQATERFYHCVLLTMTLHSTKSHNLNFLRSQAERVEPGLIPVWPRSSRFEKRCWELLRRAYVEARFSSHYVITVEELAWLIDRVSDLQQRVQKSCEAYLATIRPDDR
ncbi:HEPN domain-containing protein [Phenylobacterium koreense]|uniref:Nucleotidyltransferase/HEPN domain-containing protein n=1 Tax=Phenylobacterium koreense TaxID=266125 RepID=A0ABV2EM88_9CAUL